MNALTTVGRAAGRTGAWLGMATAGAAVGFVAERYVMGRSLKRDDPYRDERFGSLRGQPRMIATDDGVALYAEVDDVADPGAPTVVFSHGFALAQDAWHFQRRDLRGEAQLVFWDQRGHGRSGPLPEGEDVTVERLGADLGQVVDNLAPHGPVVLVGHSMGGMAVLALAAARPELFGGRVTAIALIAASGQKLDVARLGLPGYLGRLAGRAGPAAVSLLTRKPELVEEGRRMASDLAYVLTRRYGFADRDSPRLVELTARLNAAVPVDVVAAFFPLFGELDGSAAIPALSRIPVVVIGAADDAMVPARHSRELAELLPDARHVEVSDAGHMVTLERHEQVTAEIRELIRQNRKRKERR